MKGEQVYFRVEVESSVPTPFAYIASESVARIERGAGIFETYGRAHYGLPVDREDVSTVVSDLVSDLLHFAHSRDVEPGELLARIARSFEGDFEEESGAFHDAAVEGYFACALWSGLDETTGEDNPPPLDDRFGVDDLAAETIETLSREVHRFVALNREDITASGLEAGQVGHDLCLTRNGHGAGFWDRGLGELGERLSVAARELGESTLYVGDDGKLYV